MIHFIYRLAHTGRVTLSEEAGELHAKLLRVACCDIRSVCRAGAFLARETLFLWLIFVYMSSGHSFIYYKHSKAHILCVLPSSLMKQIDAWRRVNLNQRPYWHMNRGQIVPGTRVCLPSGPREVINSLVCPPVWSSYILRLAEVS